MRLIVVSTDAGNCFVPEFDSSLKLVRLASEISPSPHSRRERLIFHRRPSEGVDVLLGTCTFVRPRRKRGAEYILWDSLSARERFMPAPRDRRGRPRGIPEQVLRAERFKAGDEIEISLHPEQRGRTTGNFYFLYWLHITRYRNFIKEKLYR